MTPELSQHLAREHPKNIPQSIRQHVLDRDNNQCQLCGVGGENRLQLHHLEYRSQGGTHEHSNLVVVCFSCHNDIHNGRADLVLLELRPGIWATFPKTTRSQRTHS